MHRSPPKPMGTNKMPTLFLNTLLGDMFSCDSELLNLACRPV